MICEPILRPRLTHNIPQSASRALHAAWQRLPVFCGDWKWSEVEITDHFPDLNHVSPTRPAKFGAKTVTRLPIFAEADLGASAKHVERRTDAVPWVYERYACLTSKETAASRARPRQRRQALQDSRSSHEEAPVPA